MAIGVDTKLLNMGTGLRVRDGIIVVVITSTTTPVPATGSTELALLTSDSIPA